MAKATTDTVQEYKALREEIERGDIKPFYLLFGKEHYYMDGLCRLLMERVIPPEERDFGQIVYFGADVTANQVVSTARQYPMMIARQLVVVKEAQMMKKVEDIGVYFEGIQPTTVLVVCYKTPNDPTKSGKNIDKRSTFYKQAKKIGVAFESNQIPDYRVARWIDGYLADEGLRIDPDAAALLAESAGSDLQKITLAIDKLRKMLPEDRRRITVKDIEENVGMSRDYSVFELTKALSLKDAGTNTLMAWGRDNPDITKNSKTLSSEAESDIPGCNIGEIAFTSPKASLERTLSLACIQPRLPRMVLISPLWANKRNGCARLQVGNVLVLNRECTNARPLVRYGLVKSGKYWRTCIEDNIPL